MAEKTYPSRWLDAGGAVEGGVGCKVTESGATATIDVKRDAVDLKIDHGWSAKLDLVRVKAWRLVADVGRRGNIDGRLGCAGDGDEGRRCCGQRRRR